MRWSQFVLFLHILVAILAFGPIYIFPLIARLGQGEPAHGNFALRLTEVIERRVVIPGAAVMPLLGLWLIYLHEWDLWRSEWLIIAIAIYVPTFFFAAIFIRSWVLRLIELTKAGPPPSAEPGPPGSGPPPVAGGQEGPPPEVATLSRRLQIGGAYTQLAVAAMLILMVWKPGATFTS